MLSTSAENWEKIDSNIEESLSKTKEPFYFNVLLNANCNVRLQNLSILNV
jgi:hypothetical protein